MNPETLQILDQLIRYTLWAFLLFFLIVLIYVAARLRSRRRTLVQYFREEVEKRYQEQLSGSAGKSVESYIPATNQWRMLVHALLLALAFAGVFFVVISFTPLPFLENFVTGESWKITPLRVTELIQERFHEGFSLEGEVWNQTEEELDIQAVVKIWGVDDELLDELHAAVQPQPLPGGSPGRFTVRYTENSPFILGYQVSFTDADGGKILHVNGFDVR